MPPANSSRGYICPLQKSKWKETPLLQYHPGTFNHAFARSLNSALILNSPLFVFTPTELLFSPDPSAVYSSETSNSSPLSSVKQLLSQTDVDWQLLRHIRSNHCSSFHIHTLFSLLFLRLQSVSNIAIATL